MEDKKLDPSMEAQAETEASPDQQEQLLDPRDAQIAELQAELDSVKDKLMRAAADVQNARRRAERDRRDAEQYGGTKLARDVLAVYDNLDTALKSASDAVRETEEGFISGVELTLKELVNAFSKHNIIKIQPAVGDKFDPNTHQAMFEAPAPGAQPGSVIQVMQAGFTIGDRLLRPAMVGVASSAGQSAAAETASEET